MIIIIRWTLMLYSVYCHLLMNCLHCRVLVPAVLLQVFPAQGKVGSISLYDTLIYIWKHPWLIIHDLGILGHFVSSPYIDIPLYVHCIVWSNDYYSGTSEQRTRCWGQPFLSSVERLSALQSMCNSFMFELHWNLS